MAARIADHLYAGVTEHCRGDCDSVVMAQLGHSPPLPPPPGILVPASGTAFGGYCDNSVLNKFNQPNYRSCAAQYILIAVAQTDGQPGC